MKNLRIINKPNPTNKDFKIRHAHLSRITTSQRDYLNNISDFVIGQVSNKVTNPDVPVKGSQYFIQDLTPDKTVRKVFENFDLTKYKELAHGAVSLSQADLIELYQENID